MVLWIMKNHNQMVSIPRLCSTFSKRLMRLGIPGGLPSFIFFSLLHLFRVSRRTFFCGDPVALLFALVEAHILTCTSTSPHPTLQNIGSLSDSPRESAGLTLHRDYSDLNFLFCCHLLG
eukprot:RCo021370